MNTSNEIAFELNFSLVETIDINEMLDDYLSEGIDLHPRYDKDGNFEVDVGHNPSHSNGVNTSLDNNPTSFNLPVPKIKTRPDFIQVWSIFQRTKMKTDARIASSDGNPLVYAFKKEKNYVFKSEYDKNTIQNLMNQILSKFIDKWFASITGEVATVVCPSGNALNDTFANAFKTIAESKGKKICLYSNLLSKATTEDIKYFIFDDPNSDMNKWLFSLDDKKAEMVKSNIYKAFEKMDNEHNGLFSYHFIENPEIRNLISKSMIIHFPSHVDIDNKNVLFLDDTISRGKTLQEAYQLICSSYNPKTVTALTLFSPLKK